MRDLAKFIVAYEMNREKALSAGNLTTFHACERLRPHLTTLMGTGGFRSLLARALVLAGADAAWLREVEVDADGIMKEQEGLHARLEAGELFEGKVALLTQLIGLLTVFIGEELTARLMRDAWPEVPPGNLNFSKGEKYGKT